MAETPLPVYQRDLFEAALERLRQPRAFIQVLAGPRQVGKTTLARQLSAALGYPSHYASADEAVMFGPEWIRAQWDAARLRTQDDEHGVALLVLDEIQKVRGWSDLVKLLWDEDSTAGTRLKVVLLGSSPLLVRRGLGESLAGRFELLRVPHWSFEEMKTAFGFDIDQYLFFGGYPGAAQLVEEPDRWRRYILDSLVETTISRDVLLLDPVTKPALLRQLFQLACTHSAQILSYNKMLGQLHDAGNTTTLAHYVELLSGAGMLVGLQKYSGSVVRQRASSPKLMVLNNALASAVGNLAPAAARADAQIWGQLVESAVGAHLLKGTADLFYWREGNHEVDFIARSGSQVVAVEVTSGRRKASLPGLRAFTKRYEVTRRLLVGGQGISVEDFLSADSATWLQ